MLGIRGEAAGTGRPRASWFEDWLVLDEVRASWDWSTERVDARLLSCSCERFGEADGPGDGGGGRPSWEIVTAGTAASVLVLVL